MENIEKGNDIEIQVLKGDKLFNENTPFVINLNSPQPSEDEKKCNADLICVIDISGSMDGNKIELVKESLKILVEMMDKNDRLALVLFDNNAEIYFNLEYMSDKVKKDLIKKIGLIEARGGTNILSGLEKAVEILKNEKEKTSENRVSSVILLSDGCDNYCNDIQLAESLKKMTKGLKLSFTLNTFGYGYDHDPKIMNKLANIRDGSFFLVEDYKKVGEYFVTVLGGCVSVISKNAALTVNLLNKNSKIVKIFGEDNLYSHELKPQTFKTTMLQFICGKEYTFVLEIKVDDKDVKVGDELLEVKFNYDDLNNQKVEKTVKYNYQLTDLQIEKANEEYVRSQVYFVLEEALKLRENNNNNYGGGNNYNPGSYGGGFNGSANPFGGGNNDFPTYNNLNNNNNQSSNPFGNNNNNNQPSNPFGNNNNGPSNPFGNNNNGPSNPFGDNNNSGNPSNPFGGPSGGSGPYQNSYPGF